MVNQRPILAGGEVAGLVLCHGKIASDDLSLLSTFPNAPHPALTTLAFFT